MLKKEWSWGFQTGCRKAEAVNQNVQFRIRRPRSLLKIIFVGMTISAATAKNEYSSVVGAKVNFESARGGIEWL